ncbi:MAG: CehA/McbA family metallohydrolase [Stagnimonas sp.]|nr:CehA/McbA family metallohydrolase [Stagnimonas sp.]
MRLASLSLLGFLLVACARDEHAPESAVPTAPKAKALAAAAAPVGSWLAGDMHVHNDHSADGSALRQALDGRGPGNVSVADQIGQGVLNGLSWMPLTDHRTYDQHYDPLWESASLLLIPGEEINGSPHGTALGHLDWLVQDAVYAGRPDWSTIQTSIWDAHLQGALYGHNHPDDGQVESDGITPNERANAIGFDTMEIWNKGSGIATELRFAEYQWNRGLRFSGVGASDNHFRELWAVAGPGLPATSAFAVERSERGILQALTSGRIVIQNRLDPLTPSVTLEADLQNDGVYEALAGDELVVPPGTAGKLRVVVTQATGATINVWKNPGKFAGGTPFQTSTGTTPTATLVYDISTDDSDAWYYVEVTGVGELDSVNTAIADNPAGVTQEILTGIANQRRAITAPIFIGPRLAVPDPLIPLPPDLGGDDGARQVIGEPGAYAGFPDLAVAEGLHHLVAERHRPGATQVVYRRLAVDGSLGEEIDLAPASKAARFPRIAARGKDLFVVWQDERAGQVPRRPAIYLRHSGDGGLSWDSEQLLRELPGRAERPAIALTPAGQPVVVWQEIRAAEPFDVFAQVVGVDAAPVNLSRPGKSFNAANPVDTRSALYPASVWPAVAVRADGLIAVAYHDNRNDQDPLWTGQVITGDGTETDHWKVLVQLRKPGEAGFGNAVALGKDGEANRHPSLAYTADGALLAVWDGIVANPAGESRSIRYALSADGGASFADASDPPVIAADPNRADSQQPRLGTDADGRVRAVWFDNRAADWRWRTMTAVLGADRQWSTAEMLMAKGLNGWPATSGGAIVIASTRNAQRLQRDPTQEIFLRPVAKAVPPVVEPPVVPPTVPPATGSSGRFGGGVLGGGLLVALSLLGLARRRRAR